MSKVIKLADYKKTEAYDTSEHARKERIRAALDKINKIMADIKANNKGE